MIDFNYLKKVCKTVIATIISSRINNVLAILSINLQALSILSLACFKFILLLPPYELIFRYKNVVNLTLDIGLTT